MSRLFAQAFLVPLLPDVGQEPELRYDEDRALNVLPDGRPFIAMGHVSGTETMTEVRSEADDYDQPGDDDALTLSTITKVKTERDDFARDSAVGTRTDTRVRNEPDDEDRDARAADGFFNLGTVTHTFVRAEAEDEDRDAGAFDFGPTTKTSVKGESDDFWSEDDEAHRLPTRLTP
jgi:hypothetical protein